MVILLYVVGGLVGLVVVMALIGFALPRAHVAARSAVLAVPPDAVWRAITDVDAQVGWRRGLKRLEHLPPVDGKPSFREHTTQGAMTFVVADERAPALRITRIADDTLPFGGQWIYELTPDGAGTRLTITEDGFIKNPVFRFLSKTVFPEGRTLEQFLAALAAHLGTPAAVERAPASKLAVAGRPAQA